jgi:crystallin alpha B
MGPSLGLGDELANTVGRANQLMRIQDSDTKFEVSLDTHEYRPDELTVNVNNDMLTVEGKHEEKSEDGSSFVARHFVRKYALPRGCEAHTVNSNLSSDGVLMITAPKNPALAHNERAIPIQMQQK